MTRVAWTVEGVSDVPDVIAYRTERVPTDPNGEIPQHLFEPPDVAVEIASPGQGLWPSSRTAAAGTLHMVYRWHCWFTRSDGQSGRSAPAPSQA